MFYITGDTHGRIDIAKLNKLKNIDPTDYIIILGDVGLFWYGDDRDNYVIDKMLSMPCPVLWLDGNHENFDNIAKLPVTENWNGGRVQIYKDKIIHLMRGEVYTIDGTTFFCFGGGLSIDKNRREEGVSWWPQEMPSKEEYENGMKNLLEVEYEVDYVLTHTAPNFICKQLVPHMYPGEEKLQNYLGVMADTLTFKRWYFGHWHFDKTIDNFYALYNNIEMVE